MLPVVVLAGGLGTRLTPLTGGEVPKVLVPVGGRPFLDYKLAGLAAAGVEEVVLLVGAMAEQVEAHVARTRCGLRVTTVRDGPRLLGTAGAIAAALDDLAPEFWVTYGDTYLQVDLPAAERRFENAGARGLMTVLHNRDRWEPSNVRVEGDRVVSYEKHPPPGTHDFLDYGMVALPRAAFDDVGADRPVDLGEVFRAIVRRGEMTAFEVTERFHDVGTIEALRETEAWLADEGIWQRIAPPG